MAVAMVAKAAMAVWGAVAGERATEAAAGCKS